VSSQESRAGGVVNLVQNCIKLIDPAEPAPGGSDPQVVFNLALGNVALCNKLSNSILEGNLVEGQSDFCDAIISLT
jgi:hypothetical protein